MIYKEIAKVISTTEIAENIYKTCLKSPNIASKVKPGQFINILPSFSWNKVMRRPMSIASQEGEQIRVEINNSKILYFDKEEQRIK